MYSNIKSNILKATLISRLVLSARSLLKEAKIFMRTKLCVSADINFALNAKKKVMNHASVTYLKHGERIWLNQKKLRNQVSTKTLHMSERTSQLLVINAKWLKSLIHIAKKLNA
jgi:hypothetical protein